MKKIILLLSCWSLTYFSSGNPLFAQDFEPDDEEAIDFNQDDAPEDGFYPVEPPPFEGNPPGNFDAPENSTEIVEPAPNEPPDEPDRIRPRRGTPPFQFGNSPRSFSRPSPGRPAPSGGGGFGKASSNLRFQRTGEEQDQSSDLLTEKKKNLKSLQEQYRETFGK